MEATPEQRNSLNKLFKGNHIDRQGVVSLQRREMQEPLKILLKAKGNTDKLMAIMFSDLNKSSHELKQNPGDQFWRRATIRTLSATLEGLVFCFKEIALATGIFQGIKFTNDEIAFLTEKPPANLIGKKPRFLVFRDNFKETFKFFAKVHNVTCPTNFQQDGFTAVCETFELRNRLVHPKSFMTFCVTDKEKERSGQAIAWLDNEIKVLLDTCWQNFESKANRK